MPGRLFLLIIAGFACGTPGPPRVPASVAPWLKADPHRCLLVRDLLASMESMASRCAEKFVSQNGYTDAPPTDDSTRWVLERGEGGPWPDVLQARGGSLERHAFTAQCSARKCIVFFKLRRSVLACAFRAVSMTQVFTRLRLEPGAIGDPHCGQRRA